MRVSIWRPILAGQDITSYFTAILFKVMIYYLLSLSDLYRRDLSADCFRQFVHRFDNTGIFMRAVTRFT